MPNQQFIDDQTLVNLYIKGEESALETLLLRHKRKIFSYIMLTMKDKDLAQDIFQDTFFKVINTLKKGQYNEEGKFLPWVMRIAHNLMIDSFRHDKRMPTISGGTNSDGEDFDIFSVIPMEDKNAEQALSQSQIRKDIRKLVPKDITSMPHTFSTGSVSMGNSIAASTHTPMNRGNQQRNKPTFRRRATAKA